jgi:hypothetical protein
MIQNDSTVRSIWGRATPSQGATMAEYKRKSLKGKQYELHIRRMHSDAFCTVYHQGSEVFEWSSWSLPVVNDLFRFLFRFLFRCISVCVSRCVSRLNETLKDSTAPKTRLWSGWEVHWTAPWHGRRTTSRGDRMNRMTRMNMMWIARLVSDALRGKSPWKMQSKTSLSAPGWFLLWSLSDSFRHISKLSWS